MDTNHQICMQALESKSYESLFVRREGDECILYIRVAGQNRIFVNRLGEITRYRHVWQIRQWLQTRFAIDPDSVTVTMD